MITAIGECDNFIWIGTNQGVYKINKRNGKSVHLTKKNSQLPHNYITSIACAENGQTYIGTINGILMWDNSTFFQITTENSNIPDNCVTALAIDRDGNLWIGTYGEGLVKSTGNSIKPFSVHPIEYNNEKIYSITFDQQGNTWVEFFNNKVACFRNGQWQTYESIQSLDLNQFPAPGKFILNTPDEGTYLFEDSSFKDITPASTSGEKTCGYFNVKYSRLVICCKDGVYIFNPNNPFDVPEKITVLEYLESFGNAGSDKKDFIKPTDPRTGFGNSSILLSRI